MTTKKTTIQDVARHAGVSITTVSRFLNQRFESMSEETKSRIQAVISELNYQPNILAQGLKGNKTKTIGVLAVNISYPFCVSIIRSISDILTQNEYGLLVGESGGDGERERKQLQSLMTQKIDGLIVQSGGENLTMIEQIAKEIPVVLVDRMFQVPGVTNIVTNNETASYQLTKKMFGEGYQTVFYVTEATNDISTREERLAGYERACNNVKSPSRIIHVERGNPDSFDGALKELKKDRTKSPFAVYTANGLIALSLLPHLQSEWDIPSQLGFATFDEPDWSVLVQPGLTCIRQPTEKIGHLAAEHILKQLRNSEPLPSEHVVHVVESEIIWSSSTILG